MFNGSELCRRVGELVHIEIFLRLTNAEIVTTTEYVTITGTPFMGKNVGMSALWIGCFEFLKNNMSALTTRIYDDDICLYYHNLGPSESLLPYAELSYLFELRYLEHI